MKRLNVLSRLIARLDARIATLTGPATKAPRRVERAEAIPAHVKTDRSGSVRENVG